MAARAIGAAAPVPQRGMADRDEIFILRRRAVGLADEIPGIVETLRGEVAMCDGEIERRRRGHGIPSGPRRRRVRPASASHRMRIAVYRRVPPSQPPSFGCNERKATQGLAEDATFSPCHPRESGGPGQATERFSWTPAFAGVTAQLCREIWTPAWVADPASAFPKEAAFECRCHPRKRLLT